MVFELNRDQNDCRLIAYNAETGEKTDLLVERALRSVPREVVSQFGPIIGGAVQVLVLPRRQPYAVCVEQNR